MIYCASGTPALSCVCETVILAKPYELHMFAQPV